MKKLSVLILLLNVMAPFAHADSAFNIVPELSMAEDGIVKVDNFDDYCPDIDYLYVDTNTQQGKTMYSMLISSQMSGKPLYIQSSCTCTVNCDGRALAVFKICTKKVAATGVCP